MDAAKPWTNDEILQSFRFCNVRRMDDKVSVWLYENWYRPNKDHKNIIIACTLARLINSPETLTEIGFPHTWEPEGIKEAVRARRDEGGTIYNPAYIIRGGGSPDKIGAIVEWYLRPMYDTPPPIDTSSMRRSWEAIYSYFGMGSFMAGQIVADLRWARTGTWRDKKEWAPLGPGSKRGLNRFLDKPPNSPMNQAKFLEGLQEVMEYGHNFIPSCVTNRMEAHDWQNCLCETDKYNRALLGEGGPKAKYNGLIDDD